jgi:hypothetical protein
MSEPGAARGAGLGEALAVWALFGLLAVAVLVTYARLPATELYNTSVEGAAGGFGRALVVVNFPVALAAVAILGLVADRGRSRAVDALSLVALVCCLVVVVPGVVDQSDLDAKWANAVPGFGVALALGLTVAVVFRRGTGPVREAVPGDRVRLAAAVVIVAISVPWFFAELGFYADDVPGMGSLVYAEELTPEPGQPELRAVHLGHHHGTDGAFLALAALALTRQLGRMARPRLRLAVTGYLSLMLAYGLWNAVQDFWLEQLVKRGTVSVEIPSALRPSLSLAWLLLLAGAAALYAVLIRRPAAPALR